MMPVVTQAEPLSARSEAGRLAGVASKQPVTTTRSLPRYLITGVLSFGVDAGTLFLAHGVLGLWLPLATTLAYAVAFAVNFSLNRVWAFASTAAVPGQVVRYGVLTGVNYLITLGMVTGLAVGGMHYLLAKAISAMVIAVINYVAYRTWVFR